MFPKTQAHLRSADRYVKKGHAGRWMIDNRNLGFGVFLAIRSAKDVQAYPINGIRNQARWLSGSNGNDAPGIGCSLILIDDENVRRRVGGITINRHFEVVEGPFLLLDPP